MPHDLNPITTAEMHELDRLLRRASELADKAGLPHEAHQMLSAQGHVPALFEALARQQQADDRCRGSEPDES